ncbi:hypothetical protein Tco_0359034 [Tanacetum coccineum]
MNATDNKSSNNESSSLMNDADTDIGPTYDSDTMSEVNHDMFENVFAHGIQNHEQPESIPNTYAVNENNSNIIYDIPNMDPDKGKEEHDDVDYEQQRAFFASLINNLKCDVKKSCQNDKTFARENGKYDEYVQPLLKRKNELEEKNQEFFKRINDLDNRLRKAGQTDHTLRMLLPKEDNVNTGKQGLRFKNKNDVEIPSLLSKAKELAPCLYNIDEIEKVLLSAHKIISKEELKFKDVNLQLNYFEKALVKEMKDDLKYVMSLEDDHVYENDIFEQNSSIENENRCLKNTITELLKQAANVIEEMTKRCAQYEKDFAKLEARCISLELKSQKNSSTSVQNGHVLSDNLTLKILKP